MEARQANPIVAEILADPDREGPLAELRRLGEQSPGEGALVLEQLADAAAPTDPARASRWLTQAAALWSGGAGDAKRAARALRAATDISPADDEALAQLTKLYRDNGKHRALARLLERRAELLLERAGTGADGLRRAAVAYTALGHLLRDPPLDSPAEAIAAYNRAIATGAAARETFQAARGLYMEAEQSADALPLFAMERNHCTNPGELVALYRDEASARKLAGDAAGASAMLRRAHKLDPDAPDLAEELWRSISERVAAGDPVLPEERAEATEVLVDVAAKLEVAALPARDLAGLKLAFALAVRAIEGVPRAVELVRQAEVLVGLGAEHALALRHAEPGLEDLTLAEAAPLLGRLEAVADPDEAIDLHERVVARATTPASRAEAVALAARVAVERGSADRVRRFFTAILQGYADEPAVAELEKAAAAADRARGGTAFRGLLAEVLAAAEPHVIDGGRTRASLLRRAARIARRDLGDADQAFEWLADALFARLDGALDDPLAPLEDHAPLHPTAGSPKSPAPKTTPPPPPVISRTDASPRSRPRLPPPVSAPPPPAPPPPAPPAPSAPPPSVRLDGPPQPSAPRPPTVPPPPPVPRGAVFPPPSAAPVAAPPAPRPPVTVSSRRRVVLAPVAELRDPFAAAPAPSHARLPAVPAAGAAVKSRTSGDDLIADLFEAMHELDFCADSMEAASFTLALAMEKLCSDAGVVHLYDIDKREFVVVRTAGAGVSGLRGLRTADSDPLAAEAMRTRDALIVADPVGDARASGLRWQALRNVAGKPVTSIACARVAQGGRFLGLIELCSLGGTGAFEAGDEHALTYIAERFTEFVAAHGVMLGDDA